MPIHLLACIRVLEGVICRWKTYFVCVEDLDNFRNYHWISWQSICNPTYERGLGLFSLPDTALAFHLKSFENPTPNFV